MSDRDLILVHNHKGGTGKTMLSVHLAHYLARSGQEWTVWDADTQGNAMSWVTEHQWDGQRSIRYSEEGQADIIATIDQSTALGRDRLIVDTPPTEKIIRDLLGVVELGNGDILLCPANGRLAIGGSIKVAEEVAGTGCRVVLVPNLTDPKHAHGQSEIDALREVADLDRINAEVFQLAIPRNDQYMRRAEEEGKPIWDLDYGTRTHTGKALKALCSWINQGAPPDENPPSGESGQGGPISGDLKDRLWNQ